MRRAAACAASSLARLVSEAPAGLRGAASSAGVPAAAAAGAAPLPVIPPFAHTPKPYAGPPAAELLEKRKRFLNPALFHFYKEPLLVVEGKMQYLYDGTGRRYLDAFGGIVTVSVGHCHPKVNAAIDAQNASLQHATTIYLHDQITLFAEELAARMPDTLSVVYFVNSGSEANDLAMLMARLYTGAHDIVALRNAYHGMSHNTMGLTAHQSWKYPVPQGAGVLHALNPNPYRGRFGNDGAAYAEDVRDLLSTASSGKVAGFFAETIQGVGGAVPLADGYLPAVYDIIRERGGVCVADEVQTGFARTGSHYWGFETQGVVPDIVTMAKGIGNGVPLAAVVTTPEIAATLKQRTHFNTFGGNPVCSAAGRAVLAAIDEDGIQQNAATVGAHLMARFEGLKEKYELVGDVRGKGLMLGVELVTDRDTKAPAKEETLAVFERMRELGVLVGKGGLLGNVLRIKPPMCLTLDDADFLADALDVALADASR